MGITLKLFYFGDIFLYAIFQFHNYDSFVKSQKDGFFQRFKVLGVRF